MTRILPIKKYGIHSALNMFEEISMVEPELLAEFMGFTENEVKDLCSLYNVSYEEMRKWYDGYYMTDCLSTFSHVLLLHQLIVKNLEIIGHLRKPMKH